MRVAMVWLLVAVAVGIGGWLLLGGSGDGAALTPPNGVGGGGDVPVTPGRSGDADLSAGGEFARAVPTRELTTPAPTDLASRMTACVQVVDYERGTPIAGAVVRRLKGGAEIGFTDERGIVELPLAEREQLGIVAERYLTRLAATRLGSTTSAPQRVQLVRDRWSVRHRFVLRSEPGSAAVPEATMVVLSRGQAEAPNHTDAVVQRARLEDARLTELFAGLAPARVVQDGENVRFAIGVPYTLEFATRDGLAARVELAAVDTARIVRVDLQPGAFVRGRIVGGGQQPLAGAEITRRVESGDGGGPLALRCVTGESGAFAFGPLPNGPVTLLVRHVDHEPRAFGPIDVAAAGTPEIALVPLPQNALRGRVRRRPGGEPVAGAAVAWTLGGNPPITAVTAADGTFRLAASGDAAGRLVVSKPGYVPLAELVEAAAPMRDYDLLPAVTADRVAAGLTGVLTGVVVRAGQPLAGATVRWVPGAPAAAPEPTGRRAISGHVLTLPLTVSTDGEGVFTLETDRFGPGRLELADGGAGLDVEAIAGQRRDGLRLGN